MLIYFHIIVLFSRGINGATNITVIMLDIAVR